MTRWTLVALLLGTPTLSLAAGPPETEVVAKDEFRSSVQTEAAALEVLVTALRTEVTEGRMEVSARGMSSWGETLDAMKPIAALAESGKLVEAYRALAKARALARFGAEEALSGGKATDPVLDALRQYVDACEPRVLWVREQLRRRELRDLRERWDEARAAYDRAKEQAGVENWVQGWVQLARGLDVADELMVQILERMRAQRAPAAAE